MMNGFNLHDATTRYLRLVSSNGGSSDDNYTITTSVSIRVTPKQDHLISWFILWMLFVLSSGVAAYQVHLERQQIVRRTESDGGQEAPTVSTADLTRSMFRRLLLLAMITRIIMIPVQIWSWPLMLQFVGDSLPEVVFLSAWTLLVTFFVQLVGMATGSGNDNAPGLVIQILAYFVYTLLVVLQLFNAIATVLLYVLLCGVYAVLLAIVVYFGPKLFKILQHGQGELRVRLLTSTGVCAFVFLSHVISYAQLVINTPRRVYWWWTYGVLELLPSIVFLSIMRPGKKSKRSRNLSPGSSANVLAIRRQNSASGLRKPETTGLLSIPTNYASVESSEATTQP